MFTRLHAVELYTAVPAVVARVADEACTAKKGRKKRGDFVLLMV